MFFLKYKVRTRGKNNKLKIGFIILRNVTSFSQNLYWINCYECIRRFYNFTDYFLFS